MLIICICVSSSFVKDLTNSCLSFFVGHSVMVSLLLLMTWNVCTVCCMMQSRALQHICLTQLGLYKFGI